MDENKQDKKQLIAEMNLWITEQAKFVQSLDKESTEEYYKRLDSEIEKKRRLLPVIAGILQKKHGVQTKSAWAIPSESDRKTFKVNKPESDKPKKSKKSKNSNSNNLSKRGKSEEDKLTIDFFKVFRPLCSSDDDAMKMAKAEVTKVLQKR